MSNFTTSWKFLEKLEEAGKLEFRQIWDGQARSELEAGVGWARRAGAVGELEKFVKFATSWKLHASQIYV